MLDPKKLLIDMAATVREVALDAREMHLEPADEGGFALADVVLVDRSTLSDDEPEVWLALRDEAGEPFAQLQPGDMPDLSDDGVAVIPLRLSAGTEHIVRLRLLGWAFAEIGTLVAATGEEVYGRLRTTADQSIYPTT